MDHSIGDQVVEIEMSKLFLILLTIAAQLVFGGLSCAESRVGVYLVSSEKAPLKGGEPVLGLFEPNFRECSYCEEVEVVDSAGERLLVRAEPEPRVQFSLEDIEETRLTEIRSALDPRIRTWVALAILSDEVHDRLRELSMEFPFDTVLVEIDGKPTDLHSIATWSRGVRLSAFERREDLQNFVDDLCLSAVWVPFDEKEFERDRQRIDQIVEEDGPK